MPELRKDPVLGRWIIISQERRKRPTDFLIEKPQTSGGFCPLCPGNENTTPSEVLAYRSGENQQKNGPDWLVRVVPNKYPALVIEGGLDKAGEGLYDRMNGIGAHEVVIESPNHDDCFATLPAERMLYVLLAFKERINDLGRDPRFKYVMIFKNHGKAAGASLEHSHSQLVALPILPRMIVSELSGALSYFKYKERCIFCDIIRQEIQQDIRIVCQNEHFITLTPFAPRTPFEMWILPKEHTSDFCIEERSKLFSLAQIFSDSLLRLDRCIPDVPYNFVLHSEPLQTKGLDHYHYHFEIVPKLTSIAGFEWGSGFYINPMSPEEAADYLRQA
ncbi:MULTISPECIES: galactose-1-phosphate uridylyltransferase [Desulfosediminicola]|uniref:galactose-1-phosphate uridylyltransferase n=1 Tax=Desulfosediminicola TaxID=2886823 RepID=UPI0010AC6140|nr:galactose-1-phosphate uridylyltransferase [Desulfosediminicola ganghwensis]